MPLKKSFMTLAVPLALLLLSACATGFPAQVQRFQAMPAPQGQTFVIQPADRENEGGLEFGQYADLVRRHLVALGYGEARSAADATFVVKLDYGVDSGRDRIAYYPSPWAGSFRYRPYFSRFGYFGRYRHPFYWGFHDPFWGDPFYDGDIRTYTIYTAYLDMDIRRRADGESLFEGLAQARSRSNELPTLVPNLIEAMFTGFPGNSGETVRITVAPEREQRR